MATNNDAESECDVKQIFELSRFAQYNYKKNPPKLSIVNNDNAKSTRYVIFAFSSQNRHSEAMQG